MAVTGSDLIGLYKIWYSDNAIESLLFRNSPVARSAKKTRIGGKQYNFPALYGRGGACAGDMTVAAANAANSQAKVAEFAVSEGQMFSVFNITQKEILASLSARGAYAPAAVVKMYAAMESFRKLFATSLYGTGYGEIGNAVVATTVVGSNTVDFADKSLAVKLDIGSVFRVTNGATPASALRTSVNTVTAVDGTSVTFTATAIETWAATDFVEIEGCRDGSGNPLLPVGLAGWLPSIANRAGGTWTTYIGTSFFGVNRAVAPDRLAGQFILRNTGASEKYADAIVRGLQAVRTAGGDPHKIVVSPTIYSKIIAEVNAQTTFFQSTDVGKAKNKNNEVVKGLNEMSFLFSTSWLDNLIDDPYCPTYLGYILDDEQLEFACLTNVDTPINDGIADNAAGVQDVNAAPDVTDMYKFILEDYLTVNPGTNTVGGPAEQVSLNMYGNWVLKSPGHNCVLNFVS